MVIAAFPLGKLAYLAIKQVSRPFANGVKGAAKRSNFFKRYVCMPPAHFYNWTQAAIKMRFLGSEGKIKVRRLSDEKAIELGAELIGEAVVFGIGAATLVFEYVRSTAAADRKEEARQKEIEDLQSSVKELGLVVERQDAELRALQRFQGAIHTELKTKGLNIATE